MLLPSVLGLFIFFFIFVNKALADVVINEFLPNPSGPTSEDTEWIELYNTASSTVDLSGWQLDDIVGGGTSPYTIPSNTLISENGFFVFEKSQTNIGLNNSGDTVRLINSSGTEISTYPYSSTTEDVSYGRTQDGGSEWITFLVSTRNATNGTSLPSSTSTPVPDTPTSPPSTPTEAFTPTSKPPTFTPKPPTATPKNTATLKATAIPSPTSKPTPTTTPKKSSAVIAQVAKEENIGPTSVLGIAQEEKPSPTPSQEKNNTTNYLPFILIGIGIVFIAGFGILIYHPFGLLKQEE